MLKRLAKPRIVPSPEAAQAHEHLFMERYSRLLIGARRLTGDPDRAEELVHNAFVQFMLSRPDLASIQDIDGYLVIMLRNMNISQARRAALMPTETLSAAEYDSAEAGLRALDAYAQLQVREQLSLICDYVCRRKERSKIGSALILRFFHGYYPTEVARVLRSNREVADKWLSRARQEAQAYVADPAAMRLLAEPSGTEQTARNFSGSGGEFLSALRQRIFAAQTGRCLSHRKLHELYQSSAADVADAEYASHLVSCARCLDEVNGLLGLPSLAERFPMEAFGNDPRPPRGSGGGGGGSMSGGENLDKLIQVSHRRMRDVLEHRPKELRVAVNGYLLGSQSLSSDANKLALTVNTPERIGFVEVFSEQGFCLLFSNIEAPPDGALEQHASVELSEGRALDLNLNFSGPWPTLNLVYNDPSFGPEEAQPLNDGLPESKLLGESSGTTRETAEVRLVESSKQVLAQFGRLLSDWRFWSTPATVTALVALLVISALLFTRFRAPVSVVTAADLLQRATVAENLIAGNRDFVVHRTISLEERAVGGELLARNKIEIWQSAAKGITARRIYDEKGKLIGGDWRRSDGVQTLYHHGAQPKLQLPDPQSALRNSEAWQLSLSAKEFSSLIGDALPQLEERSNDYVINYSAAAGTPGSLVRASLVLNRRDLRATEQTVIVLQDKDEREYHFIETAFEQKALSTVAPAIFEPEPELLSAVKVETRAREAEADSTVPAPVSPAVATPELEVDVLQRLNQAGALLGEQVSLTRTREGLLHVQGIVESEARKREILNALGPTASQPAVRVDLQTVNEAVARQKPSTSTAITTQQLESSKATITVDSELRKYFSAQRGLSGEQLDQAIRSFGERMIAHSRQARRHALALKQITERFSADELRKLDPTSRAQWRALVNEHARAFQQESSALRRELQPVLGSAAEDARADVEISGEEDFARASRRLFESASANDDAVRTAFSISDESASALRIRSPQFWRALASSEGLAIRIQAKSQ